MKSRDLRSIPRVLSIAGTDPTGGAGIQADLKSIAALGGYGMAVVTSLVAQNTRGVRSVHTPPARFLAEQLEAVSDDVAIDAVKIGMLADAATIAVVRDWLDRVRPPVVVLDPVMIATSGDRLLASNAEAALRELVSQADLVTPNLPELAGLLDEPVAADWLAAIEQGRNLSRACGTVVLVKGGHLAGETSPDALVDAMSVVGATGGDVVEFSSPRVTTKNTHGTGCSLSSAVATVMARTGEWSVAVSQAKDWLQDALIHADELHVGQGNGPINHFHRLWATAETTTRGGH
ncbi:bifunctional hydroxymethylpyrimidine kinase/phosphomethylpyrimidine kinase [Arthrobacter sp. TMN-50]